MDTILRLTEEIEFPFQDANCMQKVYLLPPGPVQSLLDHGLYNPIGLIYLKIFSLPCPRIEGVIHPVLNLLKNLSFRHVQPLSPNLLFHLCHFLLFFLRAKLLEPIPSLPCLSGCPRVGHRPLGHGHFLIMPPPTPCSPLPTRMPGPSCGKSPPK
jgi:hypothetical protein